MCLIILFIGRVCSPLPQFSKNTTKSRSANFEFDFFCYFLPTSALSTTDNRPMNTIILNNITNSTQDYHFFCTLNSNVSEEPSIAIVSSALLLDSDLTLYLAYSFPSI